MSRRRGRRGYPSCGRVHWGLHAMLVGESKCEHPRMIDEEKKKEE